MKNRFIILLLISALFLRCITVVHGTQKLIFPRRIAVDTVLDELLLPFRANLFLASSRMLKAQFSDSSCAYNEQTASNKYRSLRHPIPPSGVYTRSHPYFVFNLLSKNLISGKRNLLPAERVIPNNKGSPEPADRLRPIYFSNQKHPAHDPNLYTNLSFTAPDHRILALTQQSLHKRLPLFIVYDNTLFSAFKPSSTALRTIPLHTAGLVIFRYGFSLPPVLLEIAPEILVEKMTASFIKGEYGSFFSVLQLHGLSNIINCGNHIYGPPEFATILLNLHNIFIDF